MKVALLIHKASGGNHWLHPDIVAMEPNGVEAELPTLCSLHGICILLSDVDDLFNSQVLIPAKEKPDVDWQSTNCIVSENVDFKNYIEQVGIYHQTGNYHWRYNVPTKR